MLSLQCPYSLHCDFDSGLFTVPLEQSGRKECGLRYAAKTKYRTENYQLARHVLKMDWRLCRYPWMRCRLNGSRANNITSCSCIARNI